LWRWAITEFRRPRLSRYAIQYIIEREDIIRGSSGTKKKKKLAKLTKLEDIDYLINLVNIFCSVYQVL
jgi:hypothetical protein